MVIISGKVKKGEGLGSKLSYPTANLDYERKPRLAEGSYAGAARLGNKFYKASIFIGAPKTTGQKYRVEGYLFRFSGKLYGRRLAFFVYTKVGPNKKFKSIKGLQAKLSRDKKRTRAIFKTKDFIRWYRRLKKLL